MTPEREKYFSSAEYRKTIKTGDRLIWLIGKDMIEVGTALGFDKVHGYIRMSWSLEDQGNSDLQLKGGAIIAFRIEDLTEEEKTEIVTLRLASI